MSFGADGARLDATCSPTWLLAPAVIDDAHPSPTQVIEVWTFTLQVIPQAFTTPVTVGSGQVTLQLDAPVELLT